MIDTIDKRDIQIQLDAIKYFIMDRLVVYPETDICEYEMKNLKKIRVIKMMDYLLNIFESIYESE